MGDRRTCCSSLPATSVTVRGLHSACDNRQHYRSRSRVGGPEHEPCHLWWRGSWPSEAGNERCHDGSRFARAWASRVSGEDAESVGSPATQRNVVRVHSKARDGACDGARLADAARRGAVDLADHVGPGVVPRRAKRGGARWADRTVTRIIVPPTRAARRWGPGTALRAQRLERPARVRSNRWKTYGLPRPDVGNRQDATRDVI